MKNVGGCKGKGDKITCMKAKISKGVLVLWLCVLLLWLQDVYSVQYSVQCSVQYRVFSSGAAAGRHRSDIWAGCGPHPVSPLSDTTYSDTPPLSRHQHYPHNLTYHLKMHFADGLMSGPLTFTGGITLYFTLNILSSFAEHNSAK